MLEDCLRKCMKGRLCAALLVCCSVNGYPCEALSACQAIRLEDGYQRNNTRRAQLMEDREQTFDIKADLKYPTAHICFITFAISGRSS